MLNITKASAGSGKTYNLTKNYIDIMKKGLASDRHIFKKVLAVTFTNKATDEMKSRVIEELAKGADDEQMRYLLLSILNDYSSFNISTIDKFFQKVLRAFAQEVGQYFTYEVELDQGAVLEEAVDLMFDSLGNDDNQDLLEWLIALSISAIEDGDSWNTKPKILDIGKELFSEEYRIKLRDANNSELYYSRTQVAAYRAKMQGIIDDFAAESKRIASEWVKVMKAHSLDFSDFKGGARSPFNYFKGTADGGVLGMSATLHNAYDQVDSWHTKTSKLKAEIIAAYDAGLNRLLGEMITHYDGYVRYSTAMEIKKNLYILGILNDISVNVKNYCKKKNILLLSDSTQFINRIIDGSDTPFIYERVGSWIENYLLDEFQDTSRMQWENFRPLLKDSLDRSRDCLIVGDVKQSIYRFRSSDWRLLNSQINKDFAAYQVEENYLIENWRSGRQIIEFNNSFFATLVEGVARNYDATMGEDVGGGKLIRDIYADLKQTVPPLRDGIEGHVQVNFVEGDDDKSWQEASLILVAKRIEELLKVGYKHSDIAVLVRTNNQGSQVANYLVEQDYSVVSEDSLFISSSLSVRKIVAVLEELALGNDTDLDIKEQSLYELCESVIRQMSDLERTEQAYIQAFLDTVVEYLARNGSDLVGYLRWWNQSGCRRSISASESEGSITIMTMHKAKGLGFKCAIVPFVDDSFAARSGGNIWCMPSTDYPEFADLGLLPITKKSNMMSTIFAKDYRDERLYDCIDTLNVVYVTFTRAKDELILIANKPKTESKSYNPNSVAAFMYEYSEAHLDEQMSTDYGAYPAAVNSSLIDVPKIQVEPFVSIPIGERLKLSLSSRDYFSEDNLRLRGIVLHEILSKISTADDIALGLDEAIVEGKISLSERDSLHTYLMDKLSSVADHHWFDDRYTHHNELAIISPNGEELRPDRVMFDGQTAIIVDYKFGLVQRNSYRKQMESYVALLGSCGYGPVEGYLWYVELSEICKIV